MKWVVILDDGKTYSILADSLMDISFKLQDRGLISSDYDIINIIRVSQMLILTKIIKETMPFIPAIKNSSGQWCENSVTSKRSFVIRPIICPTLLFE